MTLEQITEKLEKAMKEAEEESYQEKRFFSGSDEVEITEELIENTPEIPKKVFIYMRKQGFKFNPERKSFVQEAETF